MVRELCVVPCMVLANESSEQCIGAVKNNKLERLVAPLELSSRFSQWAGSQITAVGKFEISKLRRIYFLRKIYLFCRYFELRLDVCAVVARQKGVNN